MCQPLHVAAVPPQPSSQKQLDQRTSELAEALEQQTATSQVLEVISSSPGELAPVFATMLVNAIRLCQAKFGVQFRSEGDALRAVALHDAPRPYAEERQRVPVTRRVFTTSAVAADNSSDCC